jgi:hypothetical protein
VKWFIYFLYWRRTKPICEVIYVWIYLCKSDYGYLILIEVTPCVVHIDQLLTSQHPAPLDAAEELIWHRQVPLNISIFAWRLLRDKLPTKTNLVTRYIITRTSHFCVSSCWGIETAGPLWLLIRAWNGFPGVDSSHLSYYFLRFTYSSGSRRRRRSFL